TEAFLHPEGRLSSFAAHPDAPPIGTVPRAVGELGEIVSRRPQMSLPYYRDPEDPGESRSRRRRRPSWMATAVIVAALVTGAWLVHDGTRERKPSEPAAADAITVQGGSGSGPDATPAARSAPL